MAHATVPSTINETEIGSSKIQDPASGVFTVQEIASSFPVVIHPTSYTAVYLDPAREIAVYRNQARKTPVVRDLASETVVRDPASETAVVRHPRTDFSMVSVHDSPVVFANKGDYPVVFANKGNSPVVFANKGNSPVVCANKGDSPVVCANKRDSPVVNDSTKKNLSRHDTIMNSSVVQEPANCSSDVQDPGSSSSVVQDPYCETPFFDLSSETPIIHDIKNGFSLVSYTTNETHQVQDTITDFMEAPTKVDLSELDRGYQDQLLEKTNEILHIVGDVILCNQEILHDSHTNIHESLTILLKNRDLISSNYRKESSSEDEMSFQELLKNGFKLFRNVQLAEKKLKSDYEKWKSIEVGVRKFSTEVRKGEILIKDITNPYKSDSLKLPNAKKDSLKATQIKLNASKISIWMSYIGLNSLLAQQKINCKNIINLTEEVELFNKAALQNVVNPSVA